MELNLTDASTILRMQMEETGDLPDDSYCRNLLGAVEDCVRFLRQAHPDVAKVREDLAQLRLGTLSPTDVDLLKDAEAVLVALSEGQMQEDFERDIPAIINSFLGPVPDTAPPLPAVVRTVNRASWISKKWVQYVEWCQSAGANVTRTTLAIGGAASPILYALVQFGLRLFGVL